MKINRFTQGLTFLAIGASVASCTAKETKQEILRPNILFIMSDDHAFQAISAYGHGLNKTPNIDRIANEGAIFTKGFVTNSICAPSRAVMLTGKHSFVNGKIDNRSPFDWSQDNFPKILRRNGYQTAMIGKIHISGLPEGFDFSMVLPGQGEYYNPDFLINGERQRIQGYCTEIITEKNTRLVKNPARSGQTILLALPSKSAAPKLDARTQVPDPLR